MGLRGRAVGREVCREGIRRILRFVCVGGWNNREVWGWKVEYFTFSLWSVVAWLILWEMGDGILGLGGVRGGCEV